MPIYPARRLLLAAWLLLSGPAATVLGQTVGPTNEPLPVVPNGPQFHLQPATPGSMITPFTIDPLTSNAGAESSNIPYLQSLNITGVLRLTTHDTVNNLTVGQIAYISCDAIAYPGILNANDLVGLAAAKIGPDSTNQRGAIVLYSTEQTWCYYQQTSQFQYSMVYTTTSTTMAKTIVKGLQGLNGQNGTGPVYTIILDNTTIQNSTTNDSLGPSPTTAVAMIILYSITGIITALFLIIIVTGAVRAHRHPERYGPRVMPGRPRQSRAKGIARAMLETLPIVKFGEREEDNNKPIIPARDIELGNTRSPTSATAEGSEETQPAATETAQDDANPMAGESVSPIRVASVSRSPSPTSDTTPVPIDNNGDNGLACSVCTDDFIKGQDIRVLPCDHKFHPECIDPWLLNVSGTCPLCRVDLRPVTAPPTTSTLDFPQIPHSPLQEGRPTTPTTTTTDNATADQPATNRRRNNGLHLLNIRRMRDATPEERIVALRGYRANSVAQDQRARARISQRLSRFLGREGRDGREGEGVPDVPGREEPSPEIRA